MLTINLNLIKTIVQFKKKCLCIIVSMDIACLRTNFWSTHRQKLNHFNKSRLMFLLSLAPSHMLSGTYVFK